METDKNMFQLCRNRNKQNSLIETSASQRQNQLFPARDSRHPDSGIWMSGSVMACAGTPCLWFESAVFLVCHVLFPSVSLVFSCFFSRVQACTSLRSNGRVRACTWAAPQEAQTDKLVRPHNLDALGRGAGKNLKLDGVQKMELIRVLDNLVYEPCVIMCSHTRAGVIAQNSKWQVPIPPLKPTAPL